MNKIHLTLAFAFLNLIVVAQSPFDRSLFEASSFMADKLNQKNKKRIVVLYITDIGKQQTVAGKYMADLISVNIVNDTCDFEVFDRENLEGITETKKMIAEGFIDANQAKELGKILSVDAIITGNYTVLSNTIKISLKALDASSGFVIAATMKDLPLNEDVGSLLGIEVGTGVKNINRGFNNRPLNSNESYNNPETVNAKCQENNTGDYCFENRTNKNLGVTLITKHINGISNYESKCSLEPQQRQCFYDLIVGRGSYRIYEFKGTSYEGYTAEGQINVEQCKSKTFVIK